MIRSQSIAALLAATLAISACKPKDETAASEESAPAGAPALALLDACKIRMTQPEAHEWATKWDPAHTRTESQNPSGVRSTHWGNAAEQKSAQDMGAIDPLSVLCGNDDREKPEMKFEIRTFDSAITDIPLAPATYIIAAKAGAAKNKPGEFVVSLMLFDKSMFAATSGTLKLDRFDKNGAAGSFVLDGHEILMGSRPMHVEGTFDMPCRKGMLQGGCQSDKGEQPN